MKTSPELVINTDQTGEEPIHVVRHPAGYTLYEIPKGASMQKIIRLMKTERQNPHDPYNLPPKP